jgi:uncharacterized iron-regulated membrane protein
MSARGAAVRVHRWLGIAAAAFWLLQALTGVAIVFHWELDDATVAGAHRPTDFVAIEGTLGLLAKRGAIESVWTSAGAADRYDVSVAGVGSVRIDGAGNELRLIKVGSQSPFDTIVMLHQTLLAGDVGSWIVGVSGLLLVSTLLLGLWTAWPRRGTWRQSLRLPRAGWPRPARFYGWHRALGLWVAGPALLLVVAGTMLVFEDATAKLVGAAEPASPAPGRPMGPPLGFARIAAIALARYPGSHLTAVSFPAAARPSWQVRVRQPSEPRRDYGTSTVFIAPDGRILAAHGADAAPWSRWLVDYLYAFHTGEAGGTVGRIAVMAVGLWLATMIVLGVMLWSARRRPRRRN